MNPFSSANLGLVAYAEVEGTHGASTATNSGVRTTRISQGRYVVVLPTNMTQEDARDLIFVQPKTTAPDGLILSAKVIDTQAATKVVEIVDVRTSVDADFSIIILRTVLPPPAGAPA